MRNALLALCMLACADDPSLTFEVRVVDGAGESVLEGRAFERIDVEVFQEGGSTLSASAAVDEGFDLSVLIASAVAPTRMRMRLSGAESWIGAPPEFTALSSGGLVRVVAGPSGRCEPLGVFETAPDHRYARIGSFVIFGGSEGSSELRFYDLLQARTGVLPETFAGPAAMGRVGESGVLLVGEDARRIDISVDPSEERSAALTLHEGAGPTSTIATLPDGRAIVVGPGAAYSVVAPTLNVVVGTLNAPHPSPAIVQSEEGVFVVGGQPFIEALDLDRGTATALDVQPGALTGAVDAFAEGSAIVVLDRDGNGLRLPCIDCPGEALTLRPGRSFGALRVVDDALLRVSPLGDVQTLAVRSEPSEAVFALALESGQAILVGAGEADLCLPDAFTALP